MEDRSLNRRLPSSVRCSI